MKKILLFIQEHQTKIGTAILFVLSIAFVVYLSPRETKFKYEFQKGKPWLYEDLVAPFDFTIVKTAEELLVERLEIEQNRSVFFVKNNEIENAALATMKQELLVSFAELDIELTADNDPREFFIVKADSLLKSCFKTGILQPIDDIGAFSQVLLQDGESSKVAELSSFLSIQDASQILRSFNPSKDVELYNDLVIPILLNHLEHNVIFNEQLTQIYLQDQLDNVLPSRGLIQKGELIIFKGNLVDDLRFAKLSSLKRAYEGSFSDSNGRWYVLSGQIILVSLLFLSLFSFLYQYKYSIIEDISKLTFLLVNVLLMVVLASVIIGFGVEYIYLAPFPILPILIRAFFDNKIAIYVHLVSMLLIGYLLPNSFEFVLLQFLAGVFAIVLVQNLYKRSQLFITALQIVIVYSVSYFSLAIIQEGSIDNIEWINFAYFGANGLLTLMSFPLIYFQEKVFGLLSEVSLLELSDTNSPLLRELAQKAPGTFQHSLQVANLAEAAVQSVNGNTLLVRTGALYHDIGKMQRPLYFIENQHTRLNPHDELSFEESALMIIAHVKDGITLAKKNKLPDAVVDFIRTHHGTSKVMYFYRQYIQSMPEEDQETDKFNYPGPKPFSKETAALMMADSVEAASRSLPSHTHEAIDNLVDSIIDSQMQEGQFENADITMKEIKSIKKIFKKMLMNIYHVRIQYPK